MNKNLLTDRNIELVAPGGDLLCVEAAFRAGADAVYAGFGDLSARRENLDEKGLEKAVRIARKYGGKIYAAMNVLVKNEEVLSFSKMVLKALDIGADAIIMQDIGVMKLLKEILGNFPLHASTQTSVISAEQVLFLKDLGARRVIAERQLSVQELSELLTHGVEVEVFVHGALCLSISGQCYASGLAGGRSGNRGRCVQVCRLPFKPITSKASGEGSSDKFISAVTHPFSTKDLFLLRKLHLLCEMGVSALKIEGRHRRPEYVQTVTAIYRSALTRLQNLRDEDFDILERYARKVFNRGFTTAFLERKDSLNSGLISGRVPGNRGEFVGIARRIRNGIEVVAPFQIRVRDGFEFHHTSGIDRGSARRLYVNGKSVFECEKGDRVVISGIDGNSSNGERGELWRTCDSYFFESLKKKIPDFFGPPESNRKSSFKKITFNSSSDAPLQLFFLKGQSPEKGSILLIRGNFQFQANLIIEEARTRETTVEEITGKLQLEEFPFLQAASGLEIHLPDKVFIPHRELKRIGGILKQVLKNEKEELFRKSCETLEERSFLLRKDEMSSRLEEEITLELKISRIKTIQGKINNLRGGLVKSLCLSLETQVHEELSFVSLEKEIIHFKEFCDSSGFLASVNPGRGRWGRGAEARQLFRLLAAGGLKPVLSLAGQVIFLDDEVREKGFDVDFTAGVMNRYTAELFWDMGASCVCFSPELGVQDLEHLFNSLGGKARQAKILLFGWPSLMVVRKSLFNEKAWSDFLPEIRDGKRQIEFAGDCRTLIVHESSSDLSMVRSREAFSLLPVLNRLTSCGCRHFRLDLEFLSEVEMVRVLEMLPRLEFLLKNPGDESRRMERCGERDEIVETGRRHHERLL